ncbi:polyketide beta-ketoacyl synthase [Carbonactinospora thermoautotrophica]|uniref:Beta-ketoacyl synthase n=3 Tax=Carbonactinospora thermoautotrophica TaxID=1469144 RepID=A0A132MJM0_9ACTN|nr:beta-ketoacyl synthase N-terminal-like domain-containing protein [Carbonactinospora thermoautotrophica]KWW98072.1 polyketide beta-ketoacyl synthase [Carbonactinospora thermoautotrophica]KWX02968.1 Beta-ketoacyl synthase [Carbonactinospora thermoautotrophica]
MSRRAVITGIGVVAPNGIGADVFWKATREGISVLDRISRYDCGPYPLKVAGEVRAFDPATLIERRYLVQTDAFTHFALAAADLALADAALDLPADSPFSVGVATASFSGGNEFGQREIEQLWRQGPKYVGPYQSIAWFYAASTGQISIRKGLKGPCSVLVTDEAGGLDAIAHAGRAIRRGTAALVVGATEAPVTPYAMTCQYGHGLFSDADDPAAAYLPFTAAARGFVPAEGGALFVLEEEERALRRGARVRAVVAGHAATFTATGGFAASREGLAAAIRGALDEAGCAPEEVDVVFADALAVPDADRAEVLALHDVLGSRAAEVPVTAPKAGVGRAYAGAGALDVAAAALCLEHSLVPPTPNVSEPGYDIDLVTGRARAVEARTALVLARGLAGFNSALVLRRRS